MIVFAHRGASGYRPQNSISAVKKAIELGAKAIEFDVQLSKDGIPVIIHDFVLDKLTSNGKGWVSNYTCHELQSFNLTNRFGAEFDCEKIPTFEDFMKLLPKEMFINVEIKSIASERRDLVDRVVEILKKYPEKNNVIISSFDHVLLQMLNEKYPEYPIGMLTGTYLINMGKYFDECGLKADSINIALELVEENLIKDLHSRGYKVFVYTVNSKVLALKLKNLGIDGIFSDYPDILERE